MEMVFLALSVSSIFVMFYALCPSDQFMITRI